MVLYFYMIIVYTIFSPAWKKEKKKQVFNTQNADKIS